MVTRDVPLMGLAFASAMISVAIVLSMLGYTPAAWGAKSWPPVPADAQTTPLATPAPPPAGSGGYAFMMTQDDGSPVKWDPCRPMHYVMNNENIPIGGEGLVHDALAQLSAITGQAITYDGATNEMPSSDRPATNQELYGNRWSPVLVAWGTEAKLPGLAGDVAGYAGPMAIRDREGAPLRYISGQVVLDGEQFRRILNAQAGRSRARAIILHELAHLFGLEHVSSRQSLMYPSTTRAVSGFSDADLRGLHAVSGGQCFS